MNPRDHPRVFIPVAAVQPAATDLDEPYVGPRPFELRDQNIFFGRDHEARDLRSLVTAHPGVLLYATSGAGKSSLLNAGLIPLLNQIDCEVLPVTWVRGAVPEEIQVEKISNLYMFNALTRLNDKLPIPEASKKNSKELVNTDLISFLNTIPRRRDEYGEFYIRVLIFDQFEDLFTLYPERWKERETFFHQVADALRTDLLLRVVFAMREDYLARVDPYSAILPDKLRARFRLELLREDAAKLAVAQPMKSFGRNFDPGVVDDLVRELLKVRVATETSDSVEVTGEFVEAVQLQVVCQELWSRLRTETTVTAKHLEGLDVDATLGTFYAKAINEVILQSSIKEETLRNWFEKHFISDLGTRAMLIEGRQNTQGIPNELVKILVDRHLLRAEYRSGAMWYELTHDRFIGPIRDSNARFRKDRQLQEALKPYDDRIAAPTSPNNDQLIKDAYISKGHLLVAYDRWKEALKNYDEAIRHFPGQDELYLARSAVYYSLGQIESAIQDVDQAIQQNPKNPISYRERARLHSLTGYFEAALADYASIVKLEEASATEVHDDLLQIVRQAPYELAMRAFDLAFPISPNQAELYFERADRHRQEGYFEPAIADYDEAIRRNHSEFLAKANKAMCLGRIGRYPEALPLLDELLKAKPDYVWAYNERAIIYLKQGDLERSIEACNEALNFDPDYQWALYNKADALHRSGRNVDALIPLDRAIALDPEDLVALYLRGVVHADLGNDEQALADLDSVIALDASHQWAYIYKAIILQFRGALFEAVASATRAITINPEHVYAYAIRAEAQCKMGAYDGMLEDYEAAIRLDPRQHWWYAGKGKALGKLGRPQDANEAFKQAVRIAKEMIEKEPENFAHNGDLAWYYYQLDDISLAIEASRKAISMESNEPTLNFNLALIQLAAGRIDLASAAIKDGITKSQGMAFHRFDDVIDDLAEIARRRPELGSAAQDLSELVEDAKKARRPLRSR